MYSSVVTALSRTLLRASTLTQFSAIKAILLKLIEATSHYMTYFSRSFSQSKIDLVRTLKHEVVAVTTPLYN